MADEIKRKSVTGHLIKASGDDGIIEAIVNVFGVVDSYNERTVPGCFQESLAAGLPKCVWMHDWTEPIAKTLEAKELLPNDPLLPESIKMLGGLYCKWQYFPDIEDSWQAYLKQKNDLVTEYSIGYRLLQYSVDQETGVWDLTKIKLIESGPVLKGACPGTATLSVKQDLMDGPVGMSIEEHTELLIQRIEKRHADRESAKTLTDGFVNRLREAGEHFLALADKSTKARDAAAPDMAPTKGDLEWEASKHALRLREIRQGAKAS